MTRRNKIIIILSIILVVFAVAIFVLSPLMRKYLILGNKNQNLNGGDTINASLPGASEINANTALINKPKIFTQEPSSQSVLEARAKIFAEKFGSFSSQGNFENLKDIKSMMTNSMKTWTDNYMKTQASEQDSSDFYGVTSRAINAQILTLSDDETEARVLVTVQQEESRGSVNTSRKILYKKLLLDFNKEANEWRVDSAQWQ